MRLNFQERSELKIQSRIDPLDNSRGSPGLIPRRLRRIEKQYSFEIPRCLRRGGSLISNYIFQAHLYNKLSKNKFWVSPTILYYDSR